MGKITLKGFCDYMGNEELVRAVKNQIGLSVNDFFDTLSNVHYASQGVTGFIYYSETVWFWRKNRKVITQAMKDCAESTGESLLQMVMNFKSIKDGGWDESEVAMALYGKYNDDLTQIYNDFAWFALEEVAFRYQDYEYENRN